PSPASPTLTCIRPAGRRSSGARCTRSLADGARRGLRVALVALLLLRVRARLGGVGATLGLGAARVVVGLLHGRGLRVEVQRRSDRAQRGLGVALAELELRQPQPGLRA